MEGGIKGKIGFADYAALIWGCDWNFEILTSDKLKFRQQTYLQALLSLTYLMLIHIMYIVCFMEKYSKYSRLCLHISFIDLLLETSLVRKY